MLEERFTCTDILMFTIVDLSDVDMYADRWSISVPSCAEVVRVCNAVVPLYCG